MSTRRNAVLVTGAGGFIGQHVVRKLANLDIDVIALTRARPLPPPLAACCARLIVGDLKDPETLRSALEGVDVVCHLAADVPPSQSMTDNAPYDYSINSVTTRILVEAARDKRLTRFVYASTANMYASNAAPCNENAQISPDGPARDYFMSKLEGEQDVVQGGQTGALTGRILRVGTPYGPGEPRAKLIPTWLPRAASDKPMTLKGNAGSAYNFVYIDDVATLFAKACLLNKPGIFNAASGEHSSLQEVADTITALYGAKPSSAHHAPAPENLDGFQPVSIEKTKREFSFTPTLLADGVRLYRKGLEKGMLK